MASTSTRPELSTQARRLNSLMVLLEACMGRMPAATASLAEVAAWGEQLVVNLVSVYVLVFLHADCTTWHHRTW